MNAHTSVQAVVMSLAISVALAFVVSYALRVVAAYRRIRDAQREIQNEVPEPPPACLPHERIQVAVTLLASWSTQRPEQVDAFLVSKALHDADLLIAAASRGEEEVIEEGALAYVPPKPTGTVAELERPS